MAPINNATVTNATLAANQSRLVTINGTIGRHVNATFVNGTWVDPTLDANGNLVIVPENVDPLQNLTDSLSPNATLVDPQGCEIELPADHSIDPVIGEWCELSVQKGGFFYRGVRDAMGKLFLQRFALTRHVSLHPLDANLTSANYSANSTINGSVPAVAPALIQTQVRINLDAEVDADAEAGAEAEVETEADEDVDADADEEADAEEEAEEEEESAFLETEAETETESSEEGSYTLDSSVEIPAEAEELVMLQLETLYNRAAPARALNGRNWNLESLPNGMKLPQLPPAKHSTCSLRAKEFLTCTGGSLNDASALIGDEIKGFCLDDNVSAVVAQTFMAYNNKIKNFDGYFKRITASPTSIAPNHTFTEQFNAEQDHVRFCFMPGSLMESKRFDAKGRYFSAPLGEATGLYKPSLSVRCGSAYCVNSQAVSPNKPHTLVLNFKP
jgi:hypothetical protein